MNRDAEKLDYKPNFYNKDIDDDLKELLKNVQKSDATRVSFRKDPVPKYPKKTVVSSENFWEKEKHAPDELYSLTTLQESTYLTTHRKLSDNDYISLFRGLIDVKQWFFWDCYLVATIKSLARCIYFDTLMKTSIQKNKDWSFNLFLPLWSPDSTKIHISKEELALAQIKWNTGYKILEVWFIKHRILKRNWYLSSVSIWKAPDIKLTQDSIQIWVWWVPTQAMSEFLWYNNVERTIIDNNINTKNTILEKLRQFNPKAWNQIFVSMKRPKNISYKQKTYIAEGQKMYYHHAYSVYAIEKIWNKIESITLENPWNNKKKIKLSWMWFQNSISQMKTTKIKKLFNFTPFSDT